MARLKFLGTMVHHDSVSGTQCKFSQHIYYFINILKLATQDKLGLLPKRQEEMPQNKNILYQSFESP